MARGRSSTVVSVRLPDELVEATKSEIEGRQSFSELVRTLLVGYVAGRRSFVGEGMSMRSEDGRRSVGEATIGGVGERDYGSAAVNGYVRSHGRVPGSHHRCPCGSGRKWRDCHGKGDRRVC